ncbi:MAG: tetratricopeptide repeat protein [Phycisphaerales bacterium]
MPMPEKTTRRLILLAAIIVGVAAVAGAGIMFRKASLRSFAAEQRIIGMDFYNKGDHASALGPLSDALKQNQDDVELLLAFADTRAQVPNENARYLHSAVKLFNEVLRRDSDNLTALQHLLELYEHPAIGQLNAFAETAHAILRQQPDNLDAIAAMARFHFTAREYDKAISRITELETAEPDSLEWREFHLAVLDAQTAPESEALALCDSWIAAAPEKAMFEYLKARVYFSIGRFEESAALALTAAKRPATPAQIQQRLIGLLDMVGESDAADGMLMQARQQHGQEAWVWEQAIRRPFMVRDLPAAAAAVKAGEAARGLDANLVKWKAYIATLRADDATLVAALTSMKEIAATATGSDGVALTATAEALEKQRQFTTAEERAAAITALERAVELNPLDARPKFILGMRRYEMGELDLAMQHFGNAWTTEPDWVQAALAYADTLIVLGQPSAAMSVCAAVERRWPLGLAPVHFTFARAWMAIATSATDQQSVATTTGHDAASIIAMLEEYRARAAYQSLPLMYQLLFDAYALIDDTQATAALVQDVAENADAGAEIRLIALQAARRANIDADPTLQDHDAAESLEMLAFRINEMQSQGNIDAALELLNQQRSAAGRDGARVFGIDRLRIAFLAQHVPGSDIVAELRSFAQEHVREPDMPLFVLGIQAAWTNESLVQIALDAAHTNELAGSPRIMLAEANALLEFHPADDRKRAEAMKLIGNALNVAPDSAAAMALMSRALTLGPNPDLNAASDQLERAVNLYPARVDLYPRLISLYQQRGKFEQASAMLDRLSRYRDLPAAVRREEVRLLEQQNSIDQAIVRMTAGNIGDMDETEQVALASLLIRSGRTDEAESTLTPLVDRDQPNELALRLLAELYALTGRFEEGLALLHAHRSGSEFDDVMQQATFLRSFGRLREAEIAYRRALEVNAKDADAINGLVLTLLNLGRFEEARAHAEAGLMVAPKHPGLLRNFALASFDADAATLDLAIERVRELGPEYHALASTLAMVRAVGANTPTAAQLQQARKLAEDSPEFLPAWRLAVDLHARVENIDAAVEIARNAMFRFPAEAAPPEWLTRLLTQQGRFSDALEAARNWRDRMRYAPLLPDVAIAAILLATDRAEEAMQHLKPHERSIRESMPAESQGPSIASRALMRGMLEVGRVDEAIDAAEPQFRYPAWRDAWVNIASQLKVAVAERMLESVTPDMLSEASGALGAAAAWTSLASRSGLDAHFDRARSHAVAAVESPAMAIDARLLLGAIADLRGRTDEAEANYRAVLERQPNHPVAMNNLAFALARQGRNLTEADTLSRKVAEAYPEVPDFLDTRAAVLLSLERMPEAEAVIRQAIAKARNAPQYRLTLARVLLAQKRLDDAERELDQADALLRQASDFDRSLLPQIEAIRSEIQQARTLTLSHEGD